MIDLSATLSDLQRAVAARQLSPAEAIAHQRRRLSDLEPGLHSVIHLLDDEPLTRPACSGPLSGIGLAHKDVFDLTDRQPGLGHDAGRTWAGQRPAVAVARLQAAGATTLATLAMAEYACGATGENQHFARCVNPLASQAAVGGSSSGSAVAVASGIAYGSLGTDTAGSVRIPAATCGVLGLKTTLGLVPTDGVFPLAPSLDTVGILARSAPDARQLLQVVAGSGLMQGPRAEALRLKAWLPGAGLHPQVAHALEDFMRECGISQPMDALPAHETLTRLSEIVLHTEAAASHRTALLACTLSPSVEAVALAGLVIPADWYRATIADRVRLARLFAQTHLQAHDLLLLPALPQPVPDWAQVTPDSPQFDVKQLLALHSYMAFVNYLGFPSLVFPIAADARGLPISVQVLARPFHEADLLAFAEQAALRRFGPQGFIPHFLNQG